MFTAICFIIIIIMVDTASAQSIPEAARRHLARGEAAMEMAKSPDDYIQAIEEFQNAVRLAPRWPAAHYNLGLVYEKTEKFTEASDSFKEYLKLSPNAPDAPQIQDRIYKLEYRAEQVLTVPEIIKVLTSLSNEQAWKKTGNGSTVPIEFREADDKKADHVSVLTGSFLFGGDIYKSLPVQGPVFDYRFFVNSCPQGQHQRDYDCFGVAQIKVEIVSKKLVTVRQQSVRQDPNGFIPIGERTCVFQKQ